MGGPRRSDFKRMIPVHKPVMSEEVFEYLCPRCSQAFIWDGTLGEGGHSELFLSRCPDVRILGVDADAKMVKRAEERLQPWVERVSFCSGWADEIFAEWDGPSPAAILMDLGISAYHYSGRGRGFSFSADEPLDMRLREEERMDAAELIRTLKEKDLADLIYKYGEERYSRRIARRIVEHRRHSKIDKSVQLADIVARAMPPNARRGKIHPATRTFQALRIAVNRELERLESFLEKIPSLLAEGGRLGIISFHSLEDRLVKLAFRSLDRRTGGAFDVLTRKPLMSSPEERLSNPMSRSARFRVIEKPVSGEIE